MKKDMKNKQKKKINTHSKRKRKIKRNQYVKEKT